MTAFPDVLLIVPVVNVFLSGILLATWTFIDARERASERAFQWAVLAAFVVPVVVYLLFRDRIGERGPMRPRERAVGTVFCASLAGYLSAIVSPPDPASWGLYALVFVPVGLVVGYALIWRGGHVQIRERLVL